MKNEFTSKLNEALKRLSIDTKVPKKFPDTADSKYDDGEFERPEPYDPINVPKGDKDQAPPPLADDLNDTEWETFDKYLNAKVWMLGYNTKDTL